MFLLGFFVQVFSLSILYPPMDSGSVYTSPNAPNVRTLNGHIEIPLAKYPSRGHVAQWDFDMAVQRSDVRGVRAGVE